MTGSLSQGQMDNYRIDGLLSPVTVMTGDEAQAYLSGFESLKTRMTPWCASKQILKPHLVSTWVNELVRHPKILDAVESLIGPDLLCWSATFFAKSPKSAGYVGWHQDITYWGLEPADEVLTCWLALTDAMEENGCMCMLPGSHKAPLREHDYLPGTENMLMGAQEVSLNLEENKRVVATELRAGQMSIHHSKTLHGSLANQSPFWRIGLAINFMPTSVRQVLADGDAAMLVRGRDNFGHFNLEPDPVADFDEASLAAYRKFIQTPSGAGRVDDNNPEQFIRLERIA